MSKGRPQSSRRSNTRSRRRRQSHDDAVLALPPRAAVPDHPLIPGAEPELVVTQDALDELIDHARQNGSVAYDTEFIGELSYHPRFCVIQLATAERIAVVDAMLDLDLRGLWQLLADPAVTKIVHAGVQDLEPVVRHLDKPPANVLDTQIAAGFCRLPYPVSLSKLVADLLDVHLGKGLTFTSWDERPLSAAHLHYAADDVRYLPALHATLVKRLEAAGHLAWAQAECETLCDRALYDFDPEVQANRVRGAGGLSAKQRAILIELVTWRDRGAREHDLPPRTFLKDEVLVELARRPIRKIDDLDRVRGLPRPMIAGSGRQILDAVQQGRQRKVDKNRQEPLSEERPSERFAVDSLWGVVQAYCQGRGVDPTLIVNRRDLARIYHTGSTAGTRIHDSWREELLGDWLEAFLADQKHLHLRWQGGSLRSEPD